MVVEQLSVYLESFNSTVSKVSIFVHFRILLFYLYQVVLTVSFVDSRSR